MGLEKSPKYWDRGMEEGEVCFTTQRAGLLVPRALFSLKESLASNGFTAMGVRGLT